VMSPAPLMAAPGGWVYCVIITAEHVAIIRTAVRVARCDRRALKVVCGEIVEGAV
jgi:hypothetical protein